MREHRIKCQNCNDWMVLKDDNTMSGCSWCCLKCKNHFEYDVVGLIQYYWDGEEWAPTDWNMKAQKWITLDKDLVINKYFTCEIYKPIAFIEASCDMQGKVKWLQASPYYSLFWTYLNAFIDWGNLLEELNIVEIDNADNLKLIFKIKKCL